MQINAKLETPKPSSQYVPDWYKKTESYVTGKKVPFVGGKGINATIKKCMPVFDALTAGYIITTPCDVYVRIMQDGSQYFEWSMTEMVTFHAIEQAPFYPMENGKNTSLPKWTNPWAIKTPKGWSTWFTQPVHRESVFTILDGFVDTDTYTAPVNFPFTMKDPSWEGFIPQGTPIAQCIPIKRESWKSVRGNKKTAEEAMDATHKLLTFFFDKYKRFFWQRKEYK